jgi:F-type H+-transporting ATPase subunit epsilon
MKKSDIPQLKVIARSPFELHYEGPARSISATNKVGNFDILPGHADFFSMLKSGEVIIETDDKPVTIATHNGIITVRDDSVLLFLNM